MKHGHVSYTPINKGGEVMHNLVRITHFKEDEYFSFTNFHQSQINHTKRIKVIGYEAHHAQKNSFGEVYIHDYNYY